MEDTYFSSGQKFWERQQDVIACYSCGVWCEITSLLYGKHTSFGGMHKDLETGWIIRHENLPGFKKIRSEFQRRAWLLILRVSKQILPSSHLVIYLVNWWRHSKEITSWTTLSTNPKHISEILVLLFQISPRNKNIMRIQTLRIDSKISHRYWIMYAHQHHLKSQFIPRANTILICMYHKVASLSFWGNPHRINAIILTVGKITFCFR